MYDRNLAMSPSIAFQENRTINSWSVSALVRGRARSPVQERARETAQRRENMQKIKGGIVFTKSSQRKNNDLTDCEKDIGGIQVTNGKSRNLVR